MITTTIRPQKPGRISVHPYIQSVIFSIAYVYRKNNTPPTPLSPARGETRKCVHFCGVRR